MYTLNVLNELVIPLWFIDWIWYAIHSITI